MRRQDDQNNRVILDTMATNYPAKNVRSDLYDVFVDLAKASTCQALKLLAQGKVHYRSAKRLMEGANEELEELSPFEKVDLEMRDKIMQLVHDQVRAETSPLRLSFEEYMDLRWLTETYYELKEMERMKEGYWCRIRNRVNQISPMFYLTEHNALL